MIIFPIIRKFGILIIRIIQVQQEYRKRKQSGTSLNDELHIKNNGTNTGSVIVTDTADGLHIYSNKYANQSSNYGAKYNYDDYYEKQAVKYYAMAANYGLPIALCKLGEFYENHGEEKKAIEYYNRASDEAYFIYGVMSMNG